jgi:PAS domain S-box-containing protein
MSPSASQRIVDRVDSLLPAWATREVDELTRNRARLIAVTALAAGALAILSAAFHWVVDTRERALFNLLCAPLAGIVLATLHWSRIPSRSDAVENGDPIVAANLQPMLNVSLALLFVALLISPILSKNDFQVPILLATLPFLGSALGSLRAGVVWTGITIVVIGAITAAVWSDPVRGLVGWNALIVAAAVGVGGCLAEAGRERAHREAQASSREAADLARSRDEKAAELRASRELLAHSFRRMPALLILSDLETGRILEVNDCFERISGWRLDEVRGRTLTELDAWVSPEDRGRLAQTVLASGTTRDVEISLRTKSGREIWLLAAADVLEMNGRAHVLAQGVDISDRKRAEEALAASRKRLEERVVEGSERLRASELELARQRQLASIGTLAAGIAHQINNPIASIMASAEYALLVAGDNGGEDPIRDRALHTAIAESARCGQIVKNVLRFARQQPTARWVEDLAPVVLRAANLCRSYVAEHAGELRIETTTRKLPTLMSPIEIEQVFVNLIRNAAEALEDGGVIRIGLVERGNHAEIAVDDEGRGMPAEVLEHLCEPFTTTRLQQGGTGLGLAFAHGVIADHGGTFQAESEHGKGTRIRVTLPLVPT